MPNPNGFIRTIHDLDQKQIDALDKGGLFIVLTPDDILTLKLVRDRLREDTLGNWKTTEWDRTLETLERILKQVG